MDLLLLDVPYRVIVLTGPQQCSLKLAVEVDAFSFRQLSFSVLVATP